MSGRTLILADVGNSRTKIGVYDQSSGDWGSLQAVTTPELLELDPVAVADWQIISVNQVRLTQLRNWIAEQRGDDQVRVLCWRDFPMSLNVDVPDKLGIDRLAAAFGAVRLARRLNQPRIVVNVGTAVTIDCVDRRGVFQGGVIFPGPYTCFQALGRNAEQLPGNFQEEVPAELIGKNTAAAIGSGVWHMQIGAIKEIVSGFKQLLAGDAVDAEVEVFLTGGGAGPLRPHFEGEFRFIPDLVLQGVRFADKTS